MEFYVSTELPQTLALVLDANASCHSHGWRESRQPGQCARNLPYWSRCTSVAPAPAPQCTRRHQARGPTTSLSVDPQTFLLPTIQAASPTTPAQGRVVLSSLTRSLAEHTAHQIQHSDLGFKSTLTLRWSPPSRQLPSLQERSPLQVAIGSHQAAKASRYCTDTEGCSLSNPRPIMSIRPQTR